jgi:hypothetical protein
MTTYLVTYRPLIGKPAGREAIKQYNLLPYVDGSCRREPDFESPFPSISALCRGRNFAPRLQIGDIAIYITCLGRYPGYQEDHWRFTAILEVFQRFTSHQEAAKWYHDRQLNLPSNCIVPNNPPLPLDKSIRRLSNSSVPIELPARYTKRQLPLLNSNPVLFKWDQGYQERVKKWGVFLICKHLHPVELHNPPVITRKSMIEIFDKVPTRTPRKVTSEAFDKFKGLYRI